YDQVTRSIPDNHWSVMYKDVLKDLNRASEIISETVYTTDELNGRIPNKLAIIEIMNVYAYANLVETYGNIPYSEALDINQLLPKYDDGKEVYLDLISRLTAAVNSLDPSKASFEGNEERLYEGNVANWKKFGNSLKLKMGNMLSDDDPAAAENAIVSAVASGVFTSNDDSATYNYLSADPNTNPVYADLVLSGRSDYVAGKTIVDIMNDRNDPRRAVYFETVDGTNYVGGEIGFAANYATHSHMGDIFYTAQNPGNILDYAEVEFIMAEAAARGFAVPGTAESHYIAGITASFDYWGATGVAGYLAQPEVDYTSAIAASTATDPWKEVIGTQKWVALYNRGFAGWNTLRLLDYPVLSQPVDAQSGFPTRYLYPVLEQTLNGTNYAAAAAAIGGDAAETRLFWDKFYTFDF
ncbi:MAG TPA: SusD/RagB family nutrient-binding outer membrane lipoprotein, partial [Aequorivita sp.]|nr:SusD/RagB family nutrient-binding outer membrane lipoprotein [Aequorivita sp.]